MNWKRELRKISYKYSNKYRNGKVYIERRDNKSYYNYVRYPYNPVSNIIYNIKSGDVSTHKYNI